MAAALFKGALYNQTIAADKDFFDTAIKPTKPPCTFIIYYHAPVPVQLPRIKRFNSLANKTVIEPLNNVYTRHNLYDTMVAPNDTINLTTQPGKELSLGTLIICEMQITI